MERQRVVVVVEETEAARAALRWAVRNFMRCGDSVTLLHVYPPARSAKRQKSLRLKGFHLALSFKDICNGIAEAKVEILVIEGEMAATVVSTVSKLGASTLVVGLHDRSFLYKLGAQSLSCRILAVRQHSTAGNWFLNTELSQVEVTPLRMAEPRTPCPIFPCTIWKRTRRRIRRAYEREGRN